ncbi:MAG: hypothetical protein HC924_05755 [Synechococcaceae cyanobacterium SM2_3_2]|nr:hypothetical protein [Synechococcaceae cyanobacterium SM2_3_2]
MSEPTRVKASLWLGILLLGLWFRLPAQAVELLPHLGSHHHAISTPDPLAQAYFDQGLTLLYGFNHELARQSFEEAIQRDPTCALCYWGVAMTWGSTLNTPMGSQALPPAQAALRTAEAIVHQNPQVTPVEKALIQALHRRYWPDLSGDQLVPQTQRDPVYAAAMGQLTQKYPADGDIATLYADALMNLSPSNYWTKNGDAMPQTLAIQATLESVLAQDPDHPGANHLYVHLLEDSSTPERALTSAKRLETLVPGSGHLIHMASHLYCALGRYQDAYRVNLQAIRADEITPNGIPDPDHPSFYALAYGLHNWHVLIAAATRMGWQDIALQKADLVRARIPVVAYQLAPGLAELRTLPIQILASFEAWDPLLKLIKPSGQFPLETALWHWGRGLAWAHHQHPKAASLNWAKLKQLAQTPDLQSLQPYSGIPVASLLGAALDHLTQEIDRSQGFPGFDRGRDPIDWLPCSKRPDLMTSNL